MYSNKKSANRTVRRDYWADRVDDPLARDPLYRSIYGSLLDAIERGPITREGIESISERMTREIRAKVSGMDSIPQDAPNEKQRHELARRKDCL